MHILQTHTKTMSRSFMIHEFDSHYVHMKVERRAIRALTEMIFMFFSSVETSEPNDFPRNKNCLQLASNA